MLRQEPVLFQITYILLAICLITIPFDSFILLPAGVVLLGISLVNLFKKENKTPKNKENRIFFTLFLLFFLLNFLSIFYSQNKTFAFVKIESYVLFFMISPLFFTLNPQKMTRKRIEILLYSFMISMALVILVNYAISYNFFLETHRSYQFFYKYLSHFMHPSYQALYACVALLLSFYFITQRKKPLLFAFFSLFLLLYIFMLQSKAGIFAAILLLIFVGLYWINRKKIRYLFSALFIAIFLFIPVFLLKNIDIKINRVTTFIESLKREKDSDQNRDVRFLIWQNAWNVAIENLPFGVGIGDVHDKLNRAYEVNGLAKLQEKDYNAHNQYIETLAGTGVLGLLSLLSLFFFSFLYGIKNCKLLLPLFASIVFLFLLFESMLERKAGGDFIALFWGLLFYFTWVKEKTLN